MTTDTIVYKIQMVNSTTAKLGFDKDPLIVLANHWVHDMKACLLVLFINWSFFSKLEPGKQIIH